jgi:intracellular sulfur oxidation DsrE/DsrF family protein
LSTTNRRFWFAAIFGIAVLLTASNTWGQKEKMHRVVFELTSDNEEHWQSLLNNVENLQKAFGREHTEVEVVTHGKGLGLLRKTNTALKDRIAGIAATGVQFAACENTMRRQKLSKEELLPQAVTVDSGVAEVVRKQEAGWSYIKSGS